jgi:hypothetical protein
VTPRLCDCCRYSLSERSCRHICRPIACCMSRALATSSSRCAARDFTTLATFSHSLGQKRRSRGAAWQTRLQTSIAQCVRTNVLAPAVAESCALRAHAFPMLFRVMRSSSRQCRGAERWSSVTQRLINECLQDQKTPRQLTTPPWPPDGCASSPVRLACAAAGIAVICWEPFVLEM